MVSFLRAEVYKCCCDASESLLIEIEFSFFMVFKQLIMYSLLLMFTLLIAPMVFAQEEVLPTVDPVRLQQYEQNRQLDTNLWYIFTALYVLIVIVYFTLLFKRYIFSTLSPWLKGGFSLVILDIVLALFFYVHSYIGIVILDLGSDLSGLVFQIIIIYGFISLIPAFLIGALLGEVIGYLNRKNESNSTTGLRIGIFIGLMMVFVIIIFLVMRLA